MGRTSRLKPLDPGFWTTTSWIQLLYGVWVNMAQLGVGLAFGFPAVQVPQLFHPDSEIQITRDEASWIASVLTLFSPIGCLLSGYMMDRFGRRIMLILCQGPMCLGWLYTGLAATAREIIIGRAITGIGCGMAMGPPRLFSTEISLPNMRGVIGAFPALAMSIGITMQAGLGTVFAWQILCFVCSGFTLCNLLVFNLLPETPYYVLIKDTAENARKSLAKFRGKKYNLSAEMSQLIEFKTDNNIRKLNMMEKINIMFSTAACKPFTLINTYILITQCSGISAILMWAIEILKTANSSFDVQTGNLLMALTRLVVGTFTSMLLFRVGRKPLALTSAVGVTVVCGSLGVFIHYNTQPSIIPQLGFMAYMAFASLGYYTLPFLMMSELYPLQIRGTLSGITVSFTSIFIFSTTKVFPYLRDSMGLDWTIGMFGLCSLFGTCFLYVFLPETKELTLQEIEEYYNARRPTLVSQRRIMSLQQMQQPSIRSVNSAKSKSESLKSSDKIKIDELSSQSLSKKESMKLLLRRKLMKKDKQLKEQESFESKKGMLSMSLLSFEEEKTKLSSTITSGPSLEKSMKIYENMRSKESLHVNRDDKKGFVKKKKRLRSDEDLASSEASSSDYDDRRKKKDNKDNSDNKDNADNKDNKDNKYNKDSPDNQPTTSKSGDK